MIDLAGITAIRLTGASSIRITERRVNAAHMRLCDRNNLCDILDEIGFDTLHIRAVTGSSLRAAPYLESLGVSRRCARALGLRL